MKDFKDNNLILHKFPYFAGGKKSGTIQLHYEHVTGASL